MTTISMCMVVHNEAQRIREALLNVRPWVDEIVLVDQASDDDTVAQAQDLTDVILHETHKGYCEPDRRVAAAAASGDWILIQDADETFSERFLHDLRIITAPSGVDCFRLLRRTQVQDQPAFNEYMLRLHRRGKALYLDHIHTDPVALGVVADIPPYVCIWHRKSVDEQTLDEARTETILDAHYVNDPAYQAMKRLNYLTHPERGFWQTLTEVSE